MITPQPRCKHRLFNILQSVSLVLAMLTLLAFCSYLVWGKDGLWLIVISFSIFILVTPQYSMKWLMYRYGAQPVNEAIFPVGVFIINQLAQKAKMAVPPRLYYISSSGLNAFSAGNADDSAIAVTDGMLRLLDERELTGVLAHEISHIRNNDLWIMSLADITSRLTSLMAHIGIILLVLNLPFLFAGEIPWLLVALLILSPLISLVMQLGLSRLREYNADLFACGLTGDPRGLASALIKIDYYEGRQWEHFFLRTPTLPVLKYLRTHPPTHKRVEKLLSLAHEINRVDVL